MPIAMRGFAQDLRYALRGLRKSSSFTAVAVLTLALGIGANTAVFSVLNAVILRPLPYPAPDELAMLWSENPTQGVREGRSSYADIEEWRAESRTFADMAVFDSARVTLTDRTGSEQIGVSRVSPNIFGLLGVQPSHGRTFSEAETDERQRLVLISHRFWQTRFGGSLDAIGATLVLDRLPSRVIGILPPECEFSNDDVWEPHTMFPDWAQLRVARGAGFWSVVARLQPGVTFEQAQAEMTTIARRLQDRAPPGASLGITVVPLSVHVTGAASRLALWMLTGAVSFVLLIAITNIAGLSLARSAGRDRELAIRSALGASQAHIARQLITESVTLAVIAGITSLLVALACIRLIVSLSPGGLPRVDDARLDPLAFGYALAVSIFCGILIGVAPAVSTLRRNLKPAFHEGGRSTSGGAATRRIRRVLVAGEFAIAIVLLVGAGLLTRSLLNVQNVDSGFRTDRVLSMQLASPMYPTPSQRVQYFERVLEEARAVTGVERAAIASEFFIGGNAEQAVTVDGGMQGVPERLRFRRDEITPDFFETVGTPLLRGRWFSAADGANAPKVAVINDMMARQLWPGQDAIGRRFKLGGPAVSTPWFTVVGVVGDMRRQGPEREPIPQMFESLAQNPSRLVTLLVRTSGDPRQMMAAVQAAARQVETNAPVYGATTLDDRLRRFQAQRRFETSLLIVFALVALLLAAIGIYGLMRYSITTRTREIGIRMAVGAQRRDIVRMILREGLTLTFAGLAVGIAAALSLGQMMAGLVFGISAADPVTFAAVASLLTAVAAAACYFPARRAASINPQSALKYE